MTSQTSAVAVEIAELTENMEVRGLDFSPDGKYLAATSTMDSDEVHVWDWQAKSIVQKMKKGGGSAGPATEPLRYSPNGRYLAVGHGRSDSTTDTLSIVIHVWDAQTGNLAHYIDADSGNCESLGFTPDGQTLFRITAAGGPRPDPYTNRNSILAYSTSTWQVVWGLETIPFHPSTLAISPDGKYAAVGGRILRRGMPIQSQILIVDLVKRAIVKTINAFPEKHEIRSLAWHQDGRHIAVGTLTGTTELKGSDVVRMFDARTGNLATAGTPRWPSFTASSVDILRYSTDGKYLAESGSTVVKEGIYRHVHIWDGQRQTLLQEIHAQPGAMAFSRDGKYLAMGGDRKILIWQMK